MSLSRKRKAEDETICLKPGCGKRVFVEPTTGIAHNYCGRTHALEHRNGDIAPPHGICHSCKLPGCDKTVFFDAAEGRVHDFCSRRHAEQAMDRKIWPRSNKGIQVLGASTLSGICSLPGCGAPRFRDRGSGEIKDFCGRSHAAEAKRLGLVGRSFALEDGGVERVWEIRSSESGETGTISVMAPHHRKYNSVSNQFLEAWRHPGKPKPTIMQIYQVTPDLLCMACRSLF
jgi:hypothetical protein